MGRLLRLVLSAAALFILLIPTGAALAAEPEVRVLVPDVPGGVIVSNCYRAAGPIYGRYTFDFCLKQRGTYRVSGGGVRCDGRLDWHVSGTRVMVQLRRASCGNGFAWTGDSLSCRPSLLLGLIAALLQQKRPLLDNLACDYTPVRGTGHSPISFIARRR